MYIDWPQVSLLLLSLAGAFSARTNYRTFYSHQKRFTPDTPINVTADNDVITQWNTKDTSRERESPHVSEAKRSQEVQKVVYPEVYESNAVGEPMLQEELSTIVSMMQSLSTEVAALRGQMSNLKYQNHIIYKQLKRMNNRCMTNPGRHKWTAMCL